MTRKKTPPERIAPNAVREGNEVVYDNPICSVCGLGSKSRMDFMKYYLFIGGGSVDDLFPLKSAYKKRLLVTGIHEYCESDRDES